MTGIVTADREAIIQATVLGPGGTPAEDAVLDTGFTDYLTLSTAVVSALKLPYVGTRYAILADGSKVAVGTYQASVQWDGVHRDIIVIEAEGGSLLGYGVIVRFGRDVECH